MTMIMVKRRKRKRHRTDRHVWFWLTCCYKLMMYDNTKHNTMLLPLNLPLNPSWKLVTLDLHLHDNPVLFCSPSALLRTKRTQIQANARVSLRWFLSFLVGLLLFEAKKRKTNYYSCLRCHIHNELGLHWWEFPHAKQQHPGLGGLSICNTFEFHSECFPSFQQLKFP